MEVILNGAELTDPGIAHPYLKMIMNFPDYYGMNLDALHDCLCERTQDTEIAILKPDPDEFLDEEIAFYQKILRVMQDWSEENPHITVEEIEPEPFDMD